MCRYPEPMAALGTWSETNELFHIFVKLLEGTAIDPQLSCIQRVELLINDGDVGKMTDMGVFLWMDWCKGKPTRNHGFSDWKHGALRHFFLQANPATLSLEPTCTEWYVFKVFSRIYWAKNERIEFLAHGSILSLAFNCWMVYTNHVLGVYRAEQHFPPIVHYHVFINQIVSWISQGFSRNVNCCFSFFLACSILPELSPLPPQHIQLIQAHLIPPGLLVPHRGFPS